MWTLRVSLNSHRSSTSLSSSGTTSIVLHPVHRDKEVQSNAKKGIENNRKYVHNKRFKAENRVKKKSKKRERR